MPQLVVTNSAAPQGRAPSTFLLCANFLHFATYASRAATWLDLKKIMRRRRSIRAMLSTPENLRSDSVALLSENRWCLPRDVAKKRLTCASLKSVWRPPPVASVLSVCPVASHTRKQSNFCLGLGMRSSILPVLPFPGLTGALGG